MIVLVIAVRSLPAGFLGCYGNEWVLTPTLDRSAAEGVVFDRHYADCPNAEGAYRAWRGGRFSFPGDVQGAQEIFDLIEQLKQHRVQTVLVTDKQRSLPACATAGWQRVLKCKDIDEALSQTADAIEAGTGEDHCFVWLDTAPLVPPWRVPSDYCDLYFENDEPNDLDEEDRTGDDLEPPTGLVPWDGPLPERVDRDNDADFVRLHRSFAAAVTYVDAGLELLFEALQERGLSDELAIMITSDHGRPLGEHGIVNADVPCLYQESIHLPLVIRLPGGAQAGRRVDALTQPVDIAPTILDLFGIDVPELHGQSLVPLARGQTTEIRPYACSTSQIGERVGWALRTPEWALIVPNAATAKLAEANAELYVKPDDRWEVNNLAQHHQGWVQHLKQTLRDFIDATHRVGPLAVPPLQKMETLLPSMAKSEP